MTMDQQHLRGEEFRKDRVQKFLGENLPNGLKLQQPFLCQKNVALPIIPHPDGGSTSASRPDEGAEEDPDQKDCDLALKYLSKMLMEEDLEEKTDKFKESLALEATEKLFYDIIKASYPARVKEIRANPSENDGVDKSPHIARPKPTAQSSFPSSVDPMTFSHEIMYDDREPVLQFRNSGFEVKKDGRDGARGNKKINSHHRGVEVWSDKQNAVYNEATTPTTCQMFEQVLLWDANTCEVGLRGSLQNESATNNIPQQDYRQSQGSNGAGRSRGGRKKCRRKSSDLVDLRNLLTLCAQAVADGDRVSASKLLQEIRQHASPMGDGMQRLAHYFANALEARLDGSGFQIYRAVETKPSTADFLKACHLLLSVCPFLKVFNFFSHKTIAKAAEKAEKLHIIDFGVLYGFSWPSIIQRLSTRPGAPPKLRITGIDFPEPCFRPAQKVEETGRWLANYAESVGVPFRYNAIVEKFEKIRIEDLKIEREEVVVVRCRHRFENLLDETVVAESPRNMVLNMIREMKPEIFIHAVVNAAYDAPFFTTRFREALFHFDAVFDMVEDNVGRERGERVVMEREILGREIMNVIACEGEERIERPETYKQWQVRNERAGLRQLPLDQETVDMAKERVKACHHKDFMVDEDGQWLRQGWKGRVIYALSCWKPAY